jgi:hypothetical protein
MADPLLVIIISLPILRHILVPRKKVLRQLKPRAFRMDICSPWYPHQLQCGASSIPKIAVLERLTCHLTNPTENTNARHN